VVIIEGFNHSSGEQWLGVIMGLRTIKRSHCSGNEEDKLEQLETKTISTSGEISLFIIAFL
jgi:hypothetical protein